MGAIIIAANGDIKLPDVPNGQTYTAWRTIDPDHPCSAAETHENLCLVKIAQGEGPD